MENLTLNDQQHPQQTLFPPGPPNVVLGGGIPPIQQQQLPPQMFTTAAQLLDLTDKKLMVSLRDGRKLIGVLRSWDQFANLVLQSTTERLFTPPTPTSPGLYADILHGVFLVRGENVLLLGEIDLDDEDRNPTGYVRGDLADVSRRVEVEVKERKRREGRRGRVLRKEGFLGEEEGGGAL